VGRARRDRRARAEAASRDCSLHLLVVAWTLRIVAVHGGASPRHASASGWFRGARFLALPENDMSFNCGAVRMSSAAFMPSRSSLTPNQTATKRHEDVSSAAQPSTAALRGLVASRTRQDPPCRFTACITCRNRC
jgi:hypothetical protein